MGNQETLQIKLWFTQLYSKKLVAYKCFQMTFRIGNELWHMNTVQREKKTTLREIRVEL